MASRWRRALELLRRRGAGHGADIREAGRADCLARPELGYELGQPVADRAAIAQSQLLDVGGTGVGGADQHEQPARRSRAAASTSGASESRAEQRVDRQRVDPQSRHRPERGRRLRRRTPARRRWRKRRCRRAWRRRSRAVRVPGPRRRPARQCRPARGAEPLEACHLGLDRHAVLVADRRSSTRRQCARTARRQPARRGRPSWPGRARAPRPQAGGIGVKPENELRLRSATRLASRSPKPWRLACAGGAPARRPAADADPRR